LCQDQRFAGPQYQFAALMLEGSVFAGRRTVSFAWAITGTTHPTPNPIPIPRTAPIANSFKCVHPPRFDSHVWNPSLKYAQHTLLYSEIMLGLPPEYEIRTARLLLRCKHSGDAPLLKHAVDMSLAHLQPWMPWAMNEPSELSVIEERIARFQRDFLSGEDRAYGIFNPGGTEILGGAALHSRIGPGALEIGYWLRADCTGRGLATEAVAALTHTGFVVLGASRIEIHCDPKNVRSARVPERLEFHLQEIRIADTRSPAGESRDTMIWALSAEAYLANGSKLEASIEATGKSA